MANVGLRGSNHEALLRVAVALLRHHHTVTWVEEEWLYANVQISVKDADLTSYNDIINTALEAIEPNASIHAAKRYTRTIGGYHFQLEFEWLWADYNVMAVKYHSNGSLLYDGYVHVPVVVTETADHMFAVFNGMRTLYADREVLWTGKSMAVGDVVDIDRTVYRCDDNGWTELEGGWTWKAVSREEEWAKYYSPYGTEHRYDGDHCTYCGVEQYQTGHYAPCPGPF